MSIFLASYGSHPLKITSMRFMGAMRHIKTDNINARFNQLPDNVFIAGCRANSGNNFCAAPMRSNIFVGYIFFHCYYYQ